MQSVAKKLQKNSKIQFMLSIKNTNRLKKNPMLSNLKYSY